jgi:phage tail-like protein
MASSNTVSSYLSYLPATFQVDPFLGRFLLAFERLLSGLATHENPTTLTIPDGLEQTYDAMYNNFDPNATPANFLPWLASWVATSLREDWNEALRRRFIASMASLYSRRGTKGYLAELLSVYLDNSTVVVDDSDPTPYYFTVSFSVSSDPDTVTSSAQLAQAIIDQEKPAHTFYQLNVRFPTMQIMNNPTPTQPGIIVGKTTLLGSETVTISS